MRNGEGVEVELRQTFEMEDFGAQMTPELGRKEQELRTEPERLSKSA
jgi:hypothetical protein